MMIETFIADDSNELVHMMMETFTTSVGCRRVSDVHCWSTEQCMSLCRAVDGTCRCLTIALASSLNMGMSRISKSKASCCSRAGDCEGPTSQQPPPLHLTFLFLMQTDDRFLQNVSVAVNTKRWHRKVTRQKGPNRK